MNVSRPKHPSATTVLAAALIPLLLSGGSRASAAPYEPAADWVAGDPSFGSPRGWEEGAGIVLQFGDNCCTFLDNKNKKKKKKK